MSLTQTPPDTVSPEVDTSQAPGDQSEALARPYRLGIVGLGIALGLFSRLAAANGFGTVNSRALIVAAAATSLVLGLGLATMASERDRFGPSLTWIAAVTGLSWGALNWISPPFSESVTVWSNRDQAVLALLGVGNGILLAGLVALALVRRGPTLTVATTLLAGVAVLAANTVFLRKEWPAIIALGAAFALVLLAWDRSPRREQRFIQPEDSPRISRAALSFISVALCGTALQLWLSRTDIPRSLPAVALCALLIIAAFASMIRVRREIERRETTLSEWRSWMREIRTNDFRSEIETFDSGSTPAVTFDPRPPVGFDGEAPRALSFPNLVAAESLDTPSPVALDPLVELGADQAYDVPDLDVLSADVPSVDIPSLDLPNVDTPSTDLPALDLPNVDTPRADLPALDLPSVDIPSTDLPALDLPSVTDGPPAIDLPLAPRTELPAIDLPEIILPTAAPAAAQLPEPVLPVADLPGDAGAPVMPDPIVLPRVDLAPHASATPHAPAAQIPAPAPAPAETGGTFSSMLAAADSPPSAPTEVEVAGLETLDRWLQSPAASSRTHALLVAVEAMSLDEFESLPPEDAAMARDEIGSFLADTMPDADLVSWIDGPYFIVSYASKPVRDLQKLNQALQSTLKSTDGIHAFLRPGLQTTISDIVDEAVIGILQARQQQELAN